MGVCVSILNMKGGVGKTTISAHVMRVLYHRHQISTLLIDLDPQFNLSQCLLPRTTYENLRKNNKTIKMAMEPISKVSLFEVATEHKAPPKASEISTRLRHMSSVGVELNLIPGDFHLVKYSLVPDRAKLDSAMKRFLRFISAAKKDNDLVVIDCNPSSSFITQCALHACDHIIVPVRPDRYSILGLELVKQLLTLIPTIEPKPELSILLNDIQRAGSTTRVERELRSHPTFGDLVYENRLMHSALLEANQNYTGFATDKPVSYRQLLHTEIAAITDEIVEQLGLGS